MLEDDDTTEPRGRTTTLGGRRGVHMGMLRTRNLIETEIHGILCNSRRRHALDHLRRTTDVVALSDLADAVAERETGESPPPNDLRQSVYNSLHQTHLPRLDEERVIDYDQSTKEIRLRESAREVEVDMEVFMKYGFTWTEYYRLLGTIALLVLLAASLEVRPISFVETTLWTSAFLALIAVSTAYQFWTRRHLYLRQFLD
jgi:hypothetical protein